MTVFGWGAGGQATANANARVLRSLQNDKGYGGVGEQTTAKAKCGDLSTAPFTIKP
jgi:hypothetical protein